MSLMIALIEKEAHNIPWDVCCKQCGQELLLKMKVEHCKAKMNKINSQF